MTGRKQIISQFSGMSIDMDYMLCVPSVHAIYNSEEIVMSYGGGIRTITDAFPKEKMEELRKWVLLHEDEIIENHHKCGYGEYPLNMIEPLRPDED